MNINMLHYSNLMQTPEIVRGEIDAEDCKDISPQKKWNVLLEIFNVIMYSESFTRKRTIILENLEFCRIVTKVCDFDFLM